MVRFVRPGPVRPTTGQGQSCLDQENTVLGAWKEKFYRRSKVRSNQPKLSVKALETPVEDGVPLLLDLFPARAEDGLKSLDLIGGSNGTD